MMEVTFTVENRIGQVYEPFKTRFLTRMIEGLAEDEVLVKVRASALCGSDLHIEKLSLDSGDALIKGMIDSLEFEGAATEEGGFFSKIFR